MSTGCLLPIAPMIFQAVSTMILLFIPFRLILCLFLLIVLISESLLIALVPYYSRFRLRGASARMAFKEAWRIHMVFSVTTITGLMPRRGLYWKMIIAIIKDSPTLAS